MLSVMRNSTKAKHGSVTSFGAFATSLAARVGTGNIAGVATARVVGGPGAFFWMWVVAFIGMSIAMVEATPAQLYKHRDEDEPSLFRMAHSQRRTGRIPVFTRDSAAGIKGVEPNAWNEEVGASG